MGDHRHPRARVRHHRAALRGHPARRHGRPGRGGKVKTLLQTFGIGLYLCRGGPCRSRLWDWVAAISLGAAVVVTVVTGVDYVVQALRLRQTSERAGRKRAERAARAAARTQRPRP